MKAAGGSGDARARLDRVLAEQVYAGGGYKPFAELTRAEVEARAVELAAAAGLGPTQAAVAAVWQGLAEVMGREDAATVGELSEGALLARADRLWVVPPGGSLL